MKYSRIIGISLGLITCIKYFVFHDNDDFIVAMMLIWGYIYTQKQD